MPEKYIYKYSKITDINLCTFITIFENILSSEFLKPEFNATVKSLYFSNKKKLLKSYGFMRRESLYCVSQVFVLKSHRLQQSQRSECRVV